MPAVDGLIAATGLACDMTVVTRNVADMAVDGLAVFNPWEENGYKGQLLNRGWKAAPTPG
jgi:hypothetical protein